MEAFTRRLKSIEFVEKVSIEQNLEREKFSKLYNWRCPFLSGVMSGKRAHSSAFRCSALLFFVSRGPLVRLLNFGCPAFFSPKWFSVQKLIEQIIFVTLNHCNAAGNYNQIRFYLYFTSLGAGVDGRTSRDGWNCVR